MKNGLIHLYSGDGKGKTTAALGLAIRAHGNGENVLFVQFMKNGMSGEIAVLKALEGVEYLCAENLPKGFYSKMKDEDKEIFAKAQKKLFLDALERATELSAKKNGGVVVLDEITYAYNWELIDQNELLVFLSQKPDNLEVVLTGRNPDRKWIDLTDYFTEMTLKKHPFSKGVEARKGIEY